MASQDPISRLAQQLGERLQGASQAPEEIHKGVQQVVRGAFDRLDLVSREDFDILMDVMQRTRIRVEALEQQVSALEAALASRQDEVTSSGEATAAGKAPKVDDGHPEEDAGGGEAGR
ncbi:accessory factor UbiK family protein [Halomonas sp. ANAO-440]|uniref:accessory factor UbiK family protein n=1 Tax=Halomonas sp. ANAO-440 TaxID=2861360 RepID=UPI001CAA5E76|nr:accessory factor UbiK family protein [Halomonas sp. ANAO-440]MBZ0332491.1 accessory factor UbiK family protein [Halomonas sp. ANAO-440]